MFKRLELEAWHEIIPFLAFFLTFAVFLTVTFRALFLHRESASRLAALPLERDRDPVTPRQKDHA